MSVGSIFYLYYWDFDKIQSFREKQLQKPNFLFFVGIAFFDYIVAIAPYLGYVLYLYLATYIGWIA